MGKPKAKQPACYLSPEDGLRLVEALNGDPRLMELLNRPVPPCPSGATAAALGIPYELGGRPVPPPSLSGIARLGLIGSPFLSGPEEATVMDAWRALLALTCEPEALTPVLGLDAKVGAVRRIASAAKLSAELEARLVGEVTAEAFAPIDRKALELSAQFPGVGAQAAAELVTAMLRDVVAAFGRVPKATEDDEDEDGPPPNPTRRPDASAATGWLTWLWRPLRYSRGWIHGAFRRPAWASSSGPGRPGSRSTE